MYYDIYYMRERKRKILILNDYAMIDSFSAVKYFARNLRLTTGQNTTGRASVGHFLNYRLSGGIRTDLCMD